MGTRRALLVLLLWAPACSFESRALAPGAGDARAADGKAAVDGRLTVDAVLPADSRPAADAPVGPPDARGPDAAVTPDAPLPEIDAPPPEPDAAPPEPDAPLPEPDAAPPLPDAPPPPPDAPPPPPDAPPPPPDAGAAVGVLCGPVTCQAGQFCCIRSTGGGTTFACNPTATCPANGDAYQCDGPEDCSGGVCCATDNGSTCLAPGGACNGDVLCHFDADCVPGLHCCPRQPYPQCQDGC